MHEIILTCENAVKPQSLTHEYRPSVRLGRLDWMDYLDSRKVLAHNLRALLMYAKEHSDAGPRNAVELEAATERANKGHGVSDATVSRYLKQTHPASLDHLTKIAQAFDLQVWQLLYPGLDVANPPMLRQSQTEKELYEILAAGMKLLAQPLGVVDDAESPMPGPDRGNRPHRPQPSKGTRKHRA